MRIDSSPPAIYRQMHIRSPVTVERRS
jgi:hypothetical protein